MELNTKIVSDENLKQPFPNTCKFFHHDIMFLNVAKKVFTHYMDDWEKIK